MAKHKVVNKSIRIAARPETVWNVLLSEETFPKWCAIFMEGSYAESDWQEGGKADFKGPDGRGMRSNIITHKQNEFMEMEHAAVLIDNEEVFEGEQADAWIGLRESYRVTGNGDSSTLEIRTEVPLEDADWFNEKWEKTLAEIKIISENK